MFSRCASCAYLFGVFHPHCSWGGMVFWNPALRSLPARLLVFLGDASYSIYLCTIPNAARTMTVLDDLDNDEK